MTPLDRPMFRVIDLETTGLDPKADAVCELAFADVSAEGRVVRAYALLIDPGRPIPATASAIHHITDDQVGGEAGLAETLAAIPALGDGVWVAHSADQDRAFLPTIEGLWLCTHRWAKHLWPEAPGHGLQVLRYWLRLTPQIPDHTAVHRAMADVVVTVSLLAACMAATRERWPEVTTVEQLQARINGPCKLEVVPFKSARGVKFVDAESSLLRWIVSRAAGGEDCVYSAQQELQRRGHDYDDGEGEY